jgi:hypothetical protein
LAGGGVDLVNNVSCGAAGVGFEYVGLRIVEPDPLGVATYPTAALHDPSIANGAPTIEAWQVPIHLFYGNEAFACNDGFHTYEFTPIAQSVIDHFVVWGVTNVGIDLDYADNFTIRDSRVLNGGTGAIGIRQNNLGGNLIVENADVEGWLYGLYTAQIGATVVSGGYYSNWTDIYIGDAMDSSRSVAINHVTFGNDPTETWVDYQLSTGTGMDCLSYAGTVTMDGQTMYAPEQAANYVPFATVWDLPEGAPRAWAGLTNQQLMNRYGVAVGGVVAPSNAAAHDNIGGLFGA